MPVMSRKKSHHPQKEPKTQKIMTKHSLKTRWRAFQIWQKLGFMPWERPREAKQRKGDFYKGAIPFLNDDAKRTFTHLLLRPGYMIRDYIRGDHERYLAPLTSLIIFYAFFALVSAVLAPVQHKGENLFDREIKAEDFTVEVSDEVSVKGEHLIYNVALILKRGYTYLNLDRHPEAVTTRGESALAALEGTLRSQGIPLFIGQFFMLWLAMSVGLRRFKMGMGATAAASAYVLCQFSFFMLFAVLLTLGESQSVNVLLMLALLTVDYCQWLGVKWKKGLRLGVKTGIMYGVFLAAVFVIVSAVVVLVAWLKGV